MFSASSPQPNKQITFINTYSVSAPAVCAVKAGGRIYAVDIINKKIIKSDDYGANWSDVSTQSWIPSNDTKISMACNQTGTTLLMACEAGDFVYRSTDSGANWAKVLDATFANKPHIVASDDLHYVIVYSETETPIYTSTNYGASFTSRTPEPFNTVWGGCCSSTGSVFYLSTNGTDNLIKSTDYGVTWTAVMSTGVPFAPFAFSCSTDGTLLLGIYYINGTNCIYKSTDSGANWSISDIGIKGSAEFYKVLIYQDNSRILIYRSNTPYIAKMYVDGAWVQQALLAQYDLCQSGSYIITSDVSYIRVGQ